MNSRMALYFFLAVLPSLFQSEHPPVDAWSWMKWLTTALYQGLLAVKAFQSPQPQPPDEPPNQAGANWNLKP